MADNTRLAAGNVCEMSGPGRGGSLSILSGQDGGREKSPTCPSRGR